tara:strand:- start:270 stop:491 length:222 start_codon:yes stop_codon:yes gene_type:complete
MEEATMKISMCVLLSLLLTGCLTPLILAGGVTSSVVQHKQIKGIKEKLDDNDQIIDYTGVMDRLSVLERSCSY